MRVTAGVIRRGKRVLIALRRREDRFGGLWEFPGGKIDPGEEPGAALRRELREELGIEARVGRMLCTSRLRGPLRAIELLTFEVKVISGEPKANEHEALHWVEPGALGKYKFPALDLPIVRRLQAEGRRPPARHSRRSKP